MSVLRRLLEIPWTIRVSNSKALEIKQCKKELLQIIKEYLGYIIITDNKLLKLRMQDKVENRRGIERKSYSLLRKRKEMDKFGYAFTRQSCLKLPDFY